jgi:hypothetical protein
MVRAWRSVEVGNLNSTSSLVVLGARRAHGLGER